MKTLNVYIEINNKMVHAGRISGTDSSDARFCYDENFIQMDGIRPISCSLPLTKDPFSPSETKNYFEGLLPEGFSRKSVASWIKADENDYLPILSTLGKECLGAIYIGENPDNEPGGYRLLEEARIKSLAAEGATQSTKLLVETHLSLTGASGKAGLYYDENNNKWYLPTGKMPSTHIVKQSHVRLSKIVLNEMICLKTAKNLGIKVPDCFIIDLGNGSDADVLFATKRYDRALSENTVNGLKIPYRLHQEDFAQALGIPASLKYETEKKDYLSKMFSLISRVSSNPIKDQLLLWDMVIFNYLVGNTDCHIKNYSLLYDSSLKTTELAPAYDLVCTRVYGASSEMSLFIGEHLPISDIVRDDFELASKDAGLGKKIALNHFDSLADNFENALKSAVSEMYALGFIDAKKLGEDILKSCGFQYLK